LAEELAALAGEGVQTLLLEGGPTLAGAFLAHDLVDKLLVFVAPTIAGQGEGLAAALAEPIVLSHMTSERVGEDLLLTAYVHAP
jgi:diaminohydroxyphosphoribosylaminopyrimidine deaminase/5-amino-6-(5-phosphoribosylamino)uracil reductase